MNPIKILILEHVHIKKMLRVLEKINGKIAHGEPIDTRDLNSVIVFLREFADRCHHYKEENLFFPKMAKNTISEEMRLISALLGEHREGRVYIKNMLEAISKRGRSEKEFKEIFLDNSKKYIALLDQHIEKENMILFERARQSLSQLQMEQLERKFKIMEERVVGREKHEELRGIPYELKKAYF